MPKAKLAWMRAVFFAATSTALGCGGGSENGPASSGGAGSGGASSGGAGGGGASSGGESSGGASSGGAGGGGASSGGDPCEVKSMENLGTTSRYLSPDDSKYVENKKDENGIFQIWLGDTESSAPSACITCAAVAGAPDPGKHKFMAAWHPTGEFLFVGVEIDHWTLAPPVIDQGLMQSGININMYVTEVGGSAWSQLTYYDPNAGPAGYTGPAVTPDGMTAYWAEFIGGPLGATSFGEWRLIKADVTYDSSSGLPAFADQTDISPPNTYWIEPGNVSPDGKYLALTLDTGLEPTKATGMDQWLLDLTTGEYENLNNSPAEWDEHGVFAPNSKKITFMSSHPYPEYDALSGIPLPKTEVMMMNRDGSNLVQLTHFQVPGYQEYWAEGSTAVTAFFSKDGSQAYAWQLLSGSHFPEQLTWLITFAGRCGGDGGF